MANSRFNHRTNELSRYPEYMNNIPPSILTTRPSTIEVLTDHDIQELKYLHSETQRIKRLNIDTNYKSLLTNLYRKEQAIWKQKGVLILGFNFDTIHFAIYFKSYSKYSYFLASLRQGAIKSQGSSIEIGGSYFKVLFTGTSSYIFDNPFISLVFYTRFTPKSPQLLLQLKSNLIWSEGYRDAVKKALALVSILGEIHASPLSRLDLAIDTTGVGFTPNDLNRFVTRAKERKIYTQDYYGRTFTGFTFGKGSLMVRIYNKTIELHKSEKYWFYDLWKQNGWDSNSPVWRVEFQYRRGRLKGIQATDLDYQSQEVSALLMEGFKWLRLAIASKTDTNTGAWRTDYFWKLLRNTAEQELGGGVLVSCTVRKPNPSIDDLLPAWIGYTAKMSAIKGIRDVENLKQFIFNKAKEYLKARGTSLEEKISDKARLLSDGTQGDKPERRGL